MLAKVQFQGWRETNLCYDAAARPDWQRHGARTQVGDAVGSPVVEESDRTTGLNLSVSKVG